MRASAAVLVALFLAALALRPQIVGVGPLIPEIQDDLDTSHAVAGLLRTIPVLCMGLFAPVGAYLAGRIGTRTAMATALALIGAFGVLRATVPSAWLVVFLTLPVGVGMGLGNAIAPIAVKERVVDRPATGTGVYTTGIQIGSTVVGGARGADRRCARRLARGADHVLARRVWTAGCLAGAHTRRRAPHARDRGSRTRRFARDIAWLLVCIFALMGSAFYGLNAWLPDAYAEQGWSDQSAGLLLATMSVMAIPTSFVVPFLSDRYGGRRPWLVASSVVFFVSAVGLVATPGLAYGWALAGRHRAGRHVRARDDLAARLRGRRVPRRWAGRDDARARIHDRCDLAVRARRCP